MRLLPFFLPCVLAAAPVSETWKEFRTPSGLRVVLEERHERPLIRLELQVAWHAGELPPDGCASDLLCAVLGRCGAGGVSRFVLERTLADRGLKLGLEGRRQALAWSMLADSQDQEEAFSFLANAVFRPSLTEGITATLRDSKPSVTPEDAFRATLGFSREGITICDLDSAALYALHRRLVRPEHAVLLIQGDLNLTQARQLVLLYFGTWAPALDPSVSEKAAPLPLRVQRQVFPGSLRVAWAGSPPPEGDAKARAAHVLLSFMLERRFGSGGERGITIEAPCHEGDAGPILFRTLPAPHGDPERLLADHLEILATRGFSSSELTAAREQWRAERMVLALHPEDQLSARAHGLLFGDTGAFLDEISLEDVHLALRARLASIQWLVQGATGP